MKRLILLLMVFFVFGCGLCQANSTDGNAMAAIALYIDTGGSYVPGMDMLNKALNEIIRYKINALFLGSEVQSGNEVLRELSRCDVNNASEATAEKLLNYSNVRHVNNIIVIAARPLDIALDIKAYSLAANGFILEKTVTRPDGSVALSTIDALSAMIGDEVAQILQMIKG